MRYPALTLLVLGTAALTACVQRPILMHSAGDVALSGPRLIATLSATGPGTTRTSEETPSTLGGLVRVGTVIVAPADTGGHAKATLVLRDAFPGAHPWHIHLGTCGDEHGIAGMRGTYPPVNVGPDGRGRSVALLPFSTPESRAFSVIVHASAADTTSIACGNLSSPR